MAIESPPTETQLDPRTATSQFFTATEEAIKAADALPQPPPKPEPSEEGAPVLPSPKPTTAQATPPEPDKAVEPTKPEDILDDKWPRTADAWKARKAAQVKIVKERDEKINELSKQIESLNQQITGSTTSKELEAIKKERDELSERIALLNVAEHPKFKAHFDGRRNTQLEIAKKILGDQAGRFESLVNLPEGEYKDSQLEELVSGLGTIAQGRIANVINSLAQIDAERSNEIANWKQNRQRIEAEETTQRETATNKRKEELAVLNKEFEGAIAKAQDKENGFPAFVKRENDEAWNTKVDKRIEYAKALFSGQIDKPTAFQAIINAAAFDGVIGQNLDLIKENARLNEVIKGMKAASPTITGGQPEAGGDGETASDEEVKEGMTPQQASAAYFKGIRRRAGAV